jgi:hypothetical protein
MSDAPAHRTISAGRRSNARLKTWRADSYSGAAGVITLPVMAEANFCVVFASTVAASTGAAFCPAVSAIPHSVASAISGGPPRAAAANVVRWMNSLRVVCAISF